MVNLQNDYDLDKDGTCDHDEYAVTFPCMTYIGQGWSNEINDKEDTQALLVPRDVLLTSLVITKDNTMIKFLILKFSTFLIQIFHQS